MQKRLIIVGLSALLFFSILLFTTAQITQTQQVIVNKGANFETSCVENDCNTTIYSYDKYFNRDGVLEEIDESWHVCEEGFCTNRYYFEAIASSNGLISIDSNNLEFSQQIISIGNENINISSSPSIDGSFLTYEDILPNIDLRYQYLPHKIKEELIIKERLENLQEGDLEVTFSLSQTNDLSIENPFVCDSNMKCRPIDYDLDNNEVSILVPARFLINESTVYPVTVDPSIILGNSSIIWNGYVEETLSDDGMSLIYPRIDNPPSLTIGLIDSGQGTGRADIDWNFNSVPNLGTINNAFIYLYAESFTGPNFLNITQIEKNSSQWANTNVENEQFFYDMRNGTVYSNIVASISGSNVPLFLSFNQVGLNDINTALVGDKRFSVGLDTDNLQNVSISARDHPTPSQRPVLYLEHSLEDYTLQYDANGNMISGFGKYLEYDGWNRLSRIRDTNSTGVILADYFYDHEGNRILKTVFNPTGNGHNESTYYMNTRPADFIQVINTNGTIINETYIYLQDKLIAKIDTTGRKFFYHPDHLGSTSLVTNESGAVVEDTLYLPYGCPLTASEVSRFGYTGQENDEESGFIDYGARQYDCEFARFLQADPVIADIYNPQNLNRYAYVLNNPYKYTDPTGNFVYDVIDKLSSQLKYDINFLPDIGSGLNSFWQSDQLSSARGAWSATGEPYYDLTKAATDAGIYLTYGEDNPFGITQEGLYSSLETGAYGAAGIGLTITAASSVSTLVKTASNIDTISSLLTEKGLIESAFSSIKKFDQELTRSSNYYMSNNLYNSNNGNEGRRNPNLFQTPSGATPGGSGSSGGGSSSSGGSSGGGSGCGFTMTCGGGCGSFMSCI